MKEVFEKIKDIKDIDIGNTDLFHNKINYYVFISNTNSNKGKGIEQYCNIMNINKKDTIAIGDDMNDLSMFEQVGYKVAMENAIDIIKENADEITLSNDEDGVAVYLEKLIKNIKYVVLKIYDMEHIISKKQKLHLDMK